MALPLVFSAKGCERTAYGELVPSVTRIRLVYAAATRQSLRQARPKVQGPHRDTIPAMVMVKASMYRCVERLFHFRFLKSIWWVINFSHDKRGARPAVQYRCGSRPKLSPRCPEFEVSRRRARLVDLCASSCGSGGPSFGGEPSERCARDARRRALLYV